MQPQFRLFHADERRRLGIAKDRQQAKIAQRPVGEPVRWNREIPFMQEDLHRAPVRVYLEIRDAFVEFAQFLKDRALGGGKLGFDPIQDQTEIGKILLQYIAPHVRRLGRAKDRVAAETPLAVNPDTLVTLC